MTAPQKGRIFISYRRADSAGYAGRIYARLTAHFGEDAVFMDVDTIEAGVDFVEVLQNAVQSCDVLVALIGRSWLNIKDEAGKHRLDNPEDFVRVEIAAALNRDIRVIPVLVDGAPMPRSTELPDNLKPLARRNALQVNHHSFNTDAHRLIAQLELALEAVKEKKKREAAEKAAAEARRPPFYDYLPPRRHPSNVSREEARFEKKTTQEKTSPKPKNTLILIGGGIVILFLLGFIIKNVLAPTIPAPQNEKTATFALSSATANSTELPTEIPLTPTSEAASTGAGGQKIARPSNPGGPGDALNLTGDATSGSQIFQGDCVLCHGLEGAQGVPNPGTDDEFVPTLNPIDATMVSSDYKTFAYNIDLFVQHGSTPVGTNPAISMPAWGDQDALTQQQIADVIAYVISLNKK